MSEYNGRFMEEALSLAARAHPAPNPRVGAVVVRHGRAVGRGYHLAPGTPHAEIHALNEAGSQADSADLYVTLEPCCHRGDGKRTPPCTDSIIASGIRRVFAASEDPNPRVAGRGFQVLREAGIEVVTGLMAAGERRLNRAYHHYRCTGLPWIHLKQAVSLDGSVTRGPGERSRISSPESLAFTHELRSRSQAIMAGAGTVRIDDPSLTARPPAEEPALRVILDGRDPLEDHYRVFSDGEAPTLLVSVHDHGDLHHDTRAPGGLTSLMSRLADEKNIMKILVEAGPTLATSLMEEGLVNEYSLNMSPDYFGGGVPRFHAAEEPHGASSGWVLSETRQTGRDLYITWLRRDREGSSCLPD